MIGLDPWRVPGPWDPAPVAEAIAAGMTSFAEAGVAAESCLVGLDGSDDIEAVITDALCRRPWEVVVIGGGVRSELDLFERVVNLVHRHAPGAGIAFNSKPSETYAAAARWLPSTRLATYGTLAPGRPNHHQLDGLAGRWLPGRVHGRLVKTGWGAELGFPALVLDPAGAAVEVQLFESADLPEHWSRLDSFEGSGYRRVVTSVETAEGELMASIYVARD